MLGQSHFSLFGFRVKYTYKRTYTNILVALVNTHLKPIESFHSNLQLLPLLKEIYRNLTKRILLIIQYTNVKLFVVYFC